MVVVASSGADSFITEGQVEEEVAHTWDKTTTKTSALASSDRRSLGLGNETVNRNDLPKQNAEVAQFRSILVCPDPTVTLVCPDLTVILV